MSELLEVSKEAPPIIVLLSTFNGELFLKELLDSVLVQLQDHDHLYVRDDGSSDSTCDILRDYERNYSGKISILKLGNGQLGPSLSFGILLTWLLERERKSDVAVVSSLIFLCDQDDVWLSGKREAFISAYLNAPSTLKPLLIHSDLTVVDEQLNVLAESFWDYQGLSANKKSFTEIVFSNTVTGCATAFNLALLRIALPIPREAIMHDWWLALAASHFGHIVSIPYATVLYRQHRNNAIGALKLEMRPKFFTRFVTLLNKKTDKHLVDVGVQAIAFKERYRLDLLNRCFISMLYHCSKVRVIWFYIWAKTMCPMFKHFCVKPR